LKLKFLHTNAPYQHQPPVSLVPLFENPLPFLNSVGNLLVDTFKSLSKERVAALKPGERLVKLKQYTDGWLMVLINSGNETCYAATFSTSNNMSKTRIGKKLEKICACLPPSYMLIPVTQFVLRTEECLQALLADRLINASCQNSNMPSLHVVQTTEWLDPLEQNVIALAYTACISAKWLALLNQMMDFPQFSIPEPIQIEQPSTQIGEFLAREHFNLEDLACLQGAFARLVDAALVCVWVKQGITREKIAYCLSKYKLHESNRLDKKTMEQRLIGIFRADALSTNLLKADSYRLHDPVMLGANAAARLDELSRGVAPKSRRQKNRDKSPQRKKADESEDQLVAFVKQHITTYGAAIMSDLVALMLQEKKLFGPSFIQLSTKEKVDRLKSTLERMQRIGRVVLHTDSYFLRDVEQSEEQQLNSFLEQWERYWIPKELRDLGVTVLREEFFKTWKEGRVRDECTYYFLPDSAAENFFRVGTSALPGAGNGLFAKRDIPSGLTLAYTGPVFPSSEIPEDTIFPHGIEATISCVVGDCSVSRRFVVNGVNDGAVTCYAALINDARGQSPSHVVSLSFERDENPIVLLQFIEDASAGSEIYFDYGADYPWKEILASETCEDSIQAEGFFEATETFNYMQLMTV
jgi:hypothetical protein